MNKWIVGFTDGEGCFSVSFNLRQKMKLGFEVRLTFSISQKKDPLGINYNTLKEIQDFFKTGSIRFSKVDQTWKYEVRNINELHKVIVPFFTENKLKTSKNLDFLIFSDIVQLVRSCHHLSNSGVLKLIDLAFKMNPSGKRKYSKEVLLKLVNKVKV